MNTSVKWLLLSVLIGSAVATNYCSSSICHGKATHIACGHSGKFAQTCPKDATMATMDPSMKSLIVDAHNEKRNFIAGGNDVNHDPACRMATMKWDDELASIAALNVRQCAMNHDKCRNTDAFRFSGQNLARIGFYGTANTFKLLQKAIDLWYNEVRYSNMRFISAYPRNYKGPVIGHFTVMMADRNIRVGCAAAIYSKANVTYKIFSVACNYATTNMLDFPIYNNCSSPGSSCMAGKNPRYPNLCSALEVYAVNKWY